jgi:hypothetical protein
MSLQSMINGKFRKQSRSELEALAPRQLALLPFQSVPRPHRCCRTLRQVLRCGHILQFVSDRRKPQTNIHSSEGSAAPRNHRAGRKLRGSEVNAGQVLE